METFIRIVTACAPILVALVGIIPTVIANHKKTMGAVEALEKKINENQQKNEAGCKKIQATLEAHIREDEAETTRNRRLRILRFHDELCDRIRHRDELFAESYFEDILEDIDEYEKYTETHPGFKNNRGHTAIEHIKAVYADQKNSGGFSK